MHRLSPEDKVSFITYPPQEASKSIKPLKGLLLVSSISVFLLIALGGIVRVTNSGLACPDWPLCHGELIPPLDLSTYIEYSHRLTTTIVTGLLLISTAVAWTRYRNLRRVRNLLALSIVFLGFQVMLGAVTVLNELPPHIVTAHLAIAELIFGSLILALVWVTKPDSLYNSYSRRLVYFVLFGSIGTFVILLSGSYIVGSGTGSSCPSWPFCGDGIIPSTSAGLVHMSHRILAGIYSVFMGYLCLLIYTNKHFPKTLRNISLFLSIALASQILTGAANPWSQFSPIFKSLHLSFSTVLWGGAVALLGFFWDPAVKPKEKDFNASS